MANINPQAWNHAENGKARIGLDSATRLCEQTGLTLDWIYRGLKAGLPMEIAEAIAREEAKLPASRLRAYGLSVSDGGALPDQ